MVDGIQHVHIETHNWGKSAAFWKALGYQLEEEHGLSGLFRPSGPGQPYIYLAEVPPDQPPPPPTLLRRIRGIHARPARGGERRMVRQPLGNPALDPDGREHILQVAAAG